MVAKPVFGIGFEAVWQPVYVKTESCFTVESTFEPIFSQNKTFDPFTIRFNV